MVSEQCSNSSGNSVRNSLRLSLVRVPNLLGLCHYNCNMASLVGNLLVRRTQLYQYLEKITSSGRMQSPAIFPRIMDATKAKEAWEILQQEFQGSKKEIAIKLQNLKREFENLKMKDFESMKDYLSRVIDVVNHMKTYGENITD
ncbi:hypothetical protein EZV62_015124 [Acer yangbiense]|uniref:Uncharacterized protein n=1 Tax=Acer yangbiense TaxID=1000413 RepID=A0A5C7HTZ8_9ROSI|nr:hypothetical protein EZV62_015124 [Acer yangbiense]